MIVSPASEALDSRHYAARPGRDAGAVRGHQWVKRKRRAQHLIQLTSRPLHVGDDVSSDSLVISVGHLRENLAAEHITLDDQALRDLDRVSA